jgi:hypothetical protein
VRPELGWDAHLQGAPGWLEPFLEVSDDAAVPLACTPVHPASVGSYGSAAIGWIEAELGVSLRWWQRLAVVRQLEHDDAGRLVWASVIESASRRSGKSLRLRSMALWRLEHADLFGEPQLAVHCGRDLQIVREIQRGAWRWAEQRDWRIVRAIGRESIENGEHRWLARSVDGVYGYDVSMAYCDEAWSVAPEVVAEGLEPATLERVSPQVVLTSTAHRKATSLMPGRIGDALDVDDGSTLLLLWAAPDGADLGDEGTWRSASPHWSADRARLLASKWAAAQRGDLDRDLDDPDPVAGFASQYLNRWRLKGSPDEVGWTFVPRDAWLAALE